MLLYYNLKKVKESNVLNITYSALFMYLTEMVCITTHKENIYFDMLISV